MSKHLRTFSLSLGIAAAWSATAHAQLAGSTTWLSGAEAQIAGGLNGVAKWSPAVSGSYVVWQGYPGGQPDVFMQDQSAGANAGLVVDLSPTVGVYESAPAVDGGYVAYSRSSASTGGDIIIAAINAANNAVLDPAPTRISADSNTHYANPTLSGFYVAVEEHGKRPDDVYVMDFRFGTSPCPTMTAGAVAQYAPRISGSSLVYEDNAASASAASTVFYNLATCSRTVVNGPNALVAHPAPDVDGRYVVFVGADSDGNQQIYLYDTTGAVPLHAISAGSNPKATPRVSGNRIVWAEQFAASGWDIMYYDQAAGFRYALVSDPGDQTAPDVDGNRVVWQSSDGGIYMYGFPAQQTHGTGTQTSGSGGTVVAGCDPSTGALYDGPVQFTSTGGQGSLTHSFTLQPGYGYTICLSDGLPDGTQRMTRYYATYDVSKTSPTGILLLAPATILNALLGGIFQSAAPLPASTSSVPSVHSWTVGYMAENNTTVFVSVRVNNPTN